MSLPSEPSPASPRTPLANPWHVALAFVAGGFLSVVPMVIIISFVEGGATDATGIDGDLFGTLPMALIGGTAAFLLRRRPVPCAFAGGWFILQAALTATFSEMDWLVALLLPLVWATLLLDLPAPIRLALAVPATLLFLLAASFLSNGSTALAQASGIVAALGGAVYFVGWGLRERVRWAHTTAWAIATAWGAVAFLVALNDLFEFLDAVAIAGAVVTLALLSSVGFGWVGTQRRLVRVSTVGNG